MLPEPNAEARPEWLSDPEGILIPDDDFGGRGADLYLMGKSVLDVDSDKTTSDLKYMYYHGQQFRVIQEHMDGAVRPIKVWIIPDSIPTLMGGVIMTGMYTCVSVLPVCVASAIGFRLSQRLHRSITDEHLAEQAESLYEPS